MAVRRAEDPRLLTGTARFTEDLVAAGCLHAVFVRSGYAHARVTRISTSRVRSADAVIGVLTAHDLGLGRLPAGGAPDVTGRPALAGDTIRFLGEPLAVVVAQTRAAAVEAAELVDVDYAPLDPVVDPAAALDTKAPLVFPELGSNVVAHGTAGAGSALDGAEIVVRARFRNQRVAPVPLEPGGALAVPDADGQGLTLWTACQVPFRVRDTVAERLGLAPGRVRVRVPAVGGAFGGRAATYPEQIVIAALAVRYERPVRYVETRAETMLAMAHGRAQLQDIVLGARHDGTLTGIKVRIIADCGAYPADAIGLPDGTGRMCCGPYRLPRADYAHRCVVTNTTPIGLYRGAGRPEATALLERAIDLLAAKLGLDPATLRRRNLIADDEFPYDTPTGASYDSGAYRRTLDRVLAAAGYLRLRSEQRARRRHNSITQLGIGLCCYVEWTGFGSETASCSVAENGDVTIVTGTAPHGQGHETSLAQLAAGALGVPLASVHVVHSDTARTPRGPGTMGSRSLQVGGSAVLGAAQRTLDGARRIAAHLREADPSDIVVVPGEGLAVAGVPGTLTSWAQLAQAAHDPHRRPPGMPPGLQAHASFATPDASYPFGAHLAVVEVDTETGAAALVRYVAVDDAGRIINPSLAEGQVHGGIAQGAGQALFEEIAYDDDGNCLTGSLVAYGIPTAADLPPLDVSRTETPTPRNPLGAKGIGESGAIAAAPAVWNAVIDAVSHLGVEHIDMPTTPERIWQAIQAARHQ